MGKMDVNLELVQAANNLKPSEITKKQAAFREHFYNAFLKRITIAVAGGKAAPLSTLQLVGKCLVTKEDALVGAEGLVTGTSLTLGVIGAALAVPTAGASLPAAIVGLVGTGVGGLSIAFTLGKGLHSKIKNLKKYSGINDELITDEVLQNAQRFLLLQQIEQASYELSRILEFQIACIDTNDISAFAQTGVNRVLDNLKKSPKDNSNITITPVLLVQAALKGNVDTDNEICTLIKNLKWHSGSAYRKPGIIDQRLDIQKNTLTVNSRFHLGTNKKLNHEKYGFRATISLNHNKETLGKEIDKDKLGQHAIYNRCGLEVSAQVINAFVNASETNFNTYLVAQLNNSRSKLNPLFRGTLDKNNLTKNKLDECIFDEMDFSYSTLAVKSACGAHFNDCRFVNTDLAKINFSSISKTTNDETKIFNTQFNNALLLGTTMQEVIATGVDFTKSKLISTKLDGASFDSKTIIDTCELQGVSCVDININDKTGLSLSNLTNSTKIVDLFDMVKKIEHEMIKHKETLDNNQLSIKSNKVTLEQMESQLNQKLVKIIKEFKMKSEIKFSGGEVDFATRVKIFKSIAENRVFMRSLKSMHFDQKEIKEKGLVLVEKDDEFDRKMSEKLTNSKTPVNYSRHRGKRDFSFNFNVIDDTTEDYHKGERDEDETSKTLKKN